MYALRSERLWRPLVLHPVFQRTVSPAAVAVVARTKGNAIASQRYDRLQAGQDKGTPADHATTAYERNISNPYMQFIHAASILIRYSCVRCARKDRTILFPIPSKTKKGFHYISIKLRTIATTRPLLSQLTYIALRCASLF